MNTKLLLQIIAVLLTLILAVSVTACIFSANNSNGSNPNGNNIQAPSDTTKVPIDYSDTFWLVDGIFNLYSIYDIDYEQAMLSAIRAYVDATGDKYAYYFTAEELEALTAENNGDFYGIGVQVIFNDTAECMEIMLVMPNSPAVGKLEIGDLVTHIFVDGQRVALADIFKENLEKLAKIYPSFTEKELRTAAGNQTLDYAVSHLKGPEGTNAHFIVNRNGSEYDMNITRAKVKTVSVTAKKSIKDSKVGIVSISQFDLTTPTQFKECMNELISQGCDKFVFDVRNNPGGDLASITAVLSTILNKDDVILSTKSASGEEKITKVGVVNYSGDYATCNVAANEIGMYGKYEMVVLADSNTASAAELFTAALRDHNKAEIVGVTTYGKGSVQSIIPLTPYGGEGAIKLTTMLYYPPCGESYHGIGIVPNYEVELSGVAKETHFYKLTEDIDNQLQKAVSLLID